MTTAKVIALIRWTFVDKVKSLLYNMLSRLVRMCGSLNILWHCLSLILE